MTDTYKDLLQATIRAGILERDISYLNGNVFKEHCECLNINHSMAKKYAFEMIDLIDEMRMLKSKSKKASNEELETIESRIKEIKKTLGIKKEDT